MSFGGHVNDMMNRIKQNTALKDARSRKFKGGNDYSHISLNKTGYIFPKLSSKELEEFKLKVQKEAKKEIIKQIKFWAFTVVIPLIIGFLIFNYY